MTWVGSVPTASLLGWPFTAVGGPILTYNVWTVLAPALSAWTAFLLARYLTNDWGAGFVGGYLFGFSSYELGQMLGHLATDAVFLIPLTALFCIQRARGEISRLRFVARLTLVLLLELGLSTEVLASLCVLGAIVWLIFSIFAPSPDRPGLWRLAGDIVLTAVFTLALASPFLFYVLRGVSEVPAQINSPTRYSADLLNFVVPTQVSLLGGRPFAGISSLFTGNDSEQGAYLGLPLLVLLACYFRRHAASHYGRALLATLVVLALFSLGPLLQVGGEPTPIRLPWSLAARVPLIRQALPTRFTMYVALTAAIIAALHLSASPTHRQRIFRFTLAIIACVALVPNVSLYAWSAPSDVPFFRPQNISGELGEAPNVIVLPYDLSGRSLVWQLDSGMSFTQSPAYIGSVPTFEQSWAVLQQLAPDAISPNFSNDLAAYCATHHVSHILMAPDTPQSLVAAIAAQHWPQHLSQGIVVVDVPEATRLRYSYIHGDYWPSSSALNWMGREITVVTHDRPAVLTLSGAWRPVGQPVDVTVTDQSGSMTYRFTQADTRKVQLSANAMLTVTASNTFVADRILHNTDPRSLSIVVSLETQDTPAR